MDRDMAYQKVRIYKEGGDKWVVEGDSTTIVLYGVTAAEVATIARELLGNPPEQDE